MKIRWCWRCKMDVPMLNKQEFELCLKARKLGRPFIKKEIEKRNMTAYKWLDKGLKSYEPQRYFIEMYRVITGFEETNPNAIWHHVIDEYGADCPNCKKPLRTKKARYCAACGFGKEDFTSQDTKPLMERKPSLFKK